MNLEQLSDLEEHSVGLQLRIQLHLGVEQISALLHESLDFLVQIRDLNVLQMSRPSFSPLSALHCALDDLPCVPVCPRIPSSGSPGRI